MLAFKPWDYQRVGVDWILDHKECCLFWEMGLGKSVVTLTAIKRLIESMEVEKTLIVAPKKVAETTWTSEAEKWCHTQDLRVVKVMGTEKQRRAALATEADIYVTGRDSIVWLVGEFKGKLPFDLIVIDELTSFKNHRSQRFKAMRIARASASRVVGLTGTPAPNGLADLWGQMFCVDGGKRLGTAVTKYRTAYFNEVKWNNITVRYNLKPGAEEAIRSKLEDICLTMQAKDYLQLPSIMVHEVPVDLGATTMNKYKRFEREKVLEFKREHEGKDKTIMATSAAALMNKLAQYSNGAIYDENHNVAEIHTEKLDKLAEIVEEANGASILVFYQYKHDVPRITQRLKGYTVKTYEGEEQLKEWNKGEIDVLLAHPASTAYGLNMQAGGHYIVWFSTGWDLELYQQANARLHRQGQQHPVTVYKLIGKGTVDERANLALSGKTKTQQALMDGLKYLLNKHN